jgi:DNA-binding MarR family transcriptional regulator
VTDPDTDTWDDVGFVTSSRYRVNVFEVLKTDSPATPSTIADEQDIAITHVSRSLGELREKDLVELLVPEERHKGRYYGLTERGEAALERYSNQLAADGGDRE